VPFDAADAGPAATASSAQIAPAEVTASLRRPWNARRLISTLPVVLVSCSAGYPVARDDHAPLVSA
jgi:hypothetical protein